MITDIIKTDYGLEGKMEFTLFNKTINVLITEDIDLEYANLCVENLEKLDEAVVNKLCQYSINYCNDFCNDVGEETYDFNALRDVLNYINPTCLIISNPKDKNKVAYHLELECDWEEEHGLEWTISEGKILYVGFFENKNVWKEISYYKELNWNYVFNKTYCTLKNLPTTDIIKKNLISMSALDIIFNEEEWLRAYTWNPDWNGNNSLAIVDNGAGDTMHIIFSSEGCIIKGFDHESELSPHAQEDFEVWKGIYENVPKVLLDLLNDEAIEKDDVTFCIWQEKNQNKWQKGNVEIPEGCDDGSDYMLSRIYSLEDYLEWARDYWDLGDRLSVKEVGYIFNHQPITEEMIKKLNPNRNIKLVMNELSEIDYTIE